MVATAWLTKWIKLQRGLTMPGPAFPHADPTGGTMTQPDASTLACDLIAAGHADFLAGQSRARIAQEPTDYVARYQLAAALSAAGQADEARAELGQARLLHGLLVMKQWGADLERLQRDPGYAADLGRTLYGEGHVALASLAYDAAVEAGAREPSTLLSRALSLQHQGMAEEAVAAFEAVGRLYPSAEVTQFALPAMFAVKDGPARHAAAARRWASQYAPARPALPFTNSRDARRPLRVGYVAPSFEQIQVRQFIAPIFDHHDRTNVEVFAYANQPEEGAVFAAPVRMRSLGGLDDRQAADLIRSDRIDLLIDCWGHNAGNRLTMFAQRPAPVQASWLNYQQTTGLKAMDYVIQTDFVAGDDMAGLFEEEVWRMGDACGAFRPDPGPRSSPAPCLIKGHATFGAFINPAKLTDLTVELWAAILRGAPGSRLVLKYQYFLDPVLQLTTQARFLAAGADPDRLEFRGRTSGAEYHAEFADIDLALAPTPCPGGTTSMEALSRGVPVLTLKGQDFYAKLGLSVVAPALPEMVAETPQAYVAKALALAADPAEMQALRDRVPSRFDAAAYRDEAGMARRLEAVYRAMFQRWCGAAEAA
jgi:predicted O-linked N-acetylglucosamine transferase (SPINDLY family)